MVKNLSDQSEWRLLLSMDVITSPLGVLLLTTLFTSTASQSVPEYYAVIGGSFTLPLDYKPLNINDELKWKHGEKVILRRRNGAFKPGKAEDIDAAGSLTLKDLKPQDAGIYWAEVYSSDGTSQKVRTGKLNVLEKVQKPTVKFACPMGKATPVSFTCEVPQPQGLTFSWTLNGKDLGGETNATLNLALGDARGNGSVSCSVRNPVSTETSHAAKPTCAGDCSDCLSPEQDSKPQVKVTCTSNHGSTEVTLTCEPPWTEEWSFSWTHNGNILPGETTAKLITPLSQLKGHFSCSVTNGLRTGTSNATKLMCPATSGFSVPSALFGFDFWPMVVILTAGGGLLLLLLVITLVWCCRARHRNQKVSADNYDN